MAKAFTVYMHIQVDIDDDQTALWWIKYPKVCDVKSFSSQLRTGMYDSMSHPSFPEVCVV